MFALGERAPPGVGRAMNAAVTRAYRRRYVVMRPDDDRRRHRPLVRRGGRFVEVA